MHQYTTDMALYFEQLYIILYHLPTEFVYGSWNKLSSNYFPNVNSQVVFIMYSVRWKWNL